MKKTNSYEEIVTKSNEEILSKCVRMDRPVTHSGVYLLVKNNHVVYVGKSVDVEQRVKSHYNGTTYPQKDFDYYFFFDCPAHNLDFYEQHFIQRFLPRYNSDSRTKKAKRTIMFKEIQAKETKTEKELAFLEDLQKCVYSHELDAVLSKYEGDFFNNLNNVTICAASN